MKKIGAWVGVDGLLHLLASGFIALAIFAISSSFVLSICIAFVAGLMKELWDIFIQKDNTWSQSLHDFICNLIGIIIAILINIIQIIIN